MILNKKVYEVGRGNSFGTATGDTALLSGRIYHWKIKILGGNELKIGVTKHFTDLNRAFSDYPSGWAFYNCCAELRANSGGSGPKYGRKLGVGDIVGITLDTVEGTLSFQGNSQDWGVAFREPEKFCDGEI